MKSRILRVAAPILAISVLAALMAQSASTVGCSSTPSAHDAARERDPSAGGGTEQRDEASPPAPADEEAFLPATKAGSIHPRRTRMPPPDPPTQQAGSSRK